MVSSTIISPIKSLLIIFFEPFSLYIVYKAMVGPKYFGQDLINYMWHIGVIICSIFVHRCNSFPPFITFSRRYTVKYMTFACRGRHWRWMRWWEHRTTGAWQGGALMDMQMERPALIYDIFGLCLGIQTHGIDIQIIVWHGYI